MGNGNPFGVNMNLYNLFPTLAGRLGEWDSHIARAADMGFDWLFINPIEKPGISGSLYSIADYFQINPALCDEGRGKPEDQVRNMVRMARERGLRVMVDLVINHCAADSGLVKEHPQWFEHDGQGHIVHSWCMDGGEKVVWEDLVQFHHAGNTDNGEFYTFCQEVLDYLLSLGFEGFRCDAAYKIPAGFWHRLINETRRNHPEVVFVAETLGCTADQTRETAMAGFDFVFNSAKWWDFHGNWLPAQYNLTREVCGSIAFPESHDTDRLAAELNGNLAGLKQRYLFAAMFSAGVMMPIGYEFGFRNKLDVVETNPAAWEENTGVDLRDFISRVNQIKSRYMVLQEDAPTQFLQCNNPNVLIMWKASLTTRDEMLLVLNKDIWNNQEVYTDNLHGFIQSGKALQDVSPENSLDFIPEPFHYDLLPGQGIVLMTQRV